MLPFMTNRWPHLLCFSSLRNIVECRNTVGGKHSGSKYPLFYSCVSWGENPSDMVEVLTVTGGSLSSEPLLKGQSWAIWQKTLLYSLFSHLNLTHLSTAKAYLESSLFDIQLTRNFCCISVSANNWGYRKIPAVELLKLKTSQQALHQNTGTGLENGNLAWIPAQAALSVTDHPALGLHVRRTAFFEHRRESAPTSFITCSLILSLSSSISTMSSSSFLGS